jgi:hypothetical protein
MHSEASFAALCGVSPIEAPLWLLRHRAAGSVRIADRAL